MTTRQSGPVMSTPAIDDAATRRAKKRELDRRAQRAARERNRNRIAYLEATVQAMSQQESGGRIASLMNQLSDMTRQRDSLTKVLSSIETCIQVHREGERIQTTTPADQPPQHPDAASVRQHWPGDHAAPDTLALHLVEDTDNALDPFTPGTAAMDWGLPVPSETGHCLATATDFSSVVAAPCSFPLPGDPNREPFPESPPTHRHPPPGLTRPPSRRRNQHDDGVIVPGPDSACECLSSRHHPGSPGTPAAASIWRRANEALGGREVLSRNVLDMEDDVSDDIPVRVILEGWDAVERSRKLPPLWRKLRRTDGLQFRNCPDTERLAILRLMHRLLRYQAEPTVEQCARLPAWYLSRPSQSLPHSQAIDFFVWPGVRERFVFSQHRYCSNLFWRVFADSFRIVWPFEFRDCYRRNVETGRYCVSPEFDQRIGDINSWTMSPDFFNHFPEMYADIPVYQDIPRCLRWGQAGVTSSSSSSPPRKGRIEEMEHGSSPRSRRRSGMDGTGLSTFP